MSTLENEVKIPLRVHPGARRNEVMGFSGEVLRVKVAAPPIRGKANQELVDFFSGLLGVGKDSVSIVRGHTSRNKVIAITGLSREEILGCLLPGSFSSGGATEQYRG